VNELCCKKLLIDFDLKHQECLSLFSSKAIGYGLILFSSILKVPQIIQIVKNKSGQGLSVLSLYLEITANVLTIVFHRQHHFPISTFGETILILIQNLVTSFFVTHYD
jgi:mannose-P-dolichol utilization defect protein 1